MDDCKLKISPVVRLRRMNKTFVYFIDFLGVPLNADVRIFEVVKCEEILRMLYADVMGKMRMWEYGCAINERMPIAPTSVGVHFGPWSLRSLVTSVPGHFGPKTELDIQFGP